MTFQDLPPFAAWEHREARRGFEVAYLTATGAGLHVHGSTSAVEAGKPWVVSYEIDLDERWRTRHAVVTSRTLAGDRAVVLDHDGAGSWRVDGAAAPDLTGCLDIDLESSALTNAFPVRRARPRPGDRIEAPAAYVHASGSVVERLEQTYRRLEQDEPDAQRYEYAALAFGFTCELTLDGAGLCMAYPGLATRAG
ncbi:MAG: uncharacterized protein QOF53_3592 [Nocardioidaceae bacterium]|nr:uncharacterized protein [Nocardioidaceae bacterium]